MILRISWWVIMEIPGTEAIRQTWNFQCNLNFYEMKRLICFCIVASVIISCSKSNDVKYYPQQKNLIQIGVLLSLSGTGFSSGEASQVSLNIARQDILNYFDSVGVRCDLALDIADTRTDTNEALKQLKAFHEKGIRLVIGPYSSAELSAIRSFANDHEMFILSPSSVAISLAIPGDNIFRFVSCDVIQGLAMSKMLSEDKVKMLVPILRNDVWGNDLLKATQTDFVKRGGLVSTPQNYNPASSDFSAVLTQLSEKVTEFLKTYDPNDVAVYMLSFAEGSQILAQAKNYQNLNNVYWYGSSAFAANSSAIADTNAALFAYTHGLPCPVFGLDVAAKSKWQPLREQIKSKIGRYPDVYALTAYDALWVMTKTHLVVGGNTGIENFKKAFVSEADNFFGATGHTLLDVNGDRAIGNYDFWSVKNDSSNYIWKLTACYNSTDGTLVRFKP